MESQVLERKKGVLPLVQIQDHPFQVDVMKDELRSLFNPSKRLPFEGMVDNEMDHGYKFFLDSKNLTLVHVHAEMIQIPESLVLVEIPDVMVLDPIGMARKYGLRDEFFLKTYGYKSSIQAKVINASQSGLLEFVERNKKRRMESGFGNGVKK